nr:L,D-transpeptidase [Mesorhizobium sp.]
MKINSLAKTRTSLAALLLPLLLGACATTQSAPSGDPMPYVDPATAARYVAPVGEEFPVAPVDISKIDPKNLRQIVDYQTDQPPGTIVVDTANRFLYLVQEGGKAMRYGVGVGQEGLEFKGTATINHKREWPRWTPTQDMIKREPERYAQWAGGMEGGSENPLGPRALYLFKDGEDTLFRIHGTTQPETIGQAVSSGCIRLINQDVIDLYSRVPDGSQVVVL